MAAALQRATAPVITGSWTPVLTFATPGDLSVAYSSQIGNYIQYGAIGAGIIVATFSVVASSFTHSSASGNLTINGLPVPAANISGHIWLGSGRVSGVTKANYTDFAARVALNGSAVTLSASGSAQATALVTAADVPTGGTPSFTFTVTYQI